MRQVPLALAPEPLASFASFLPGLNAGALTHLRAALPPAAPIYLWGATGTGKTHLLRALASACQETGLRAGWFGAGDALPWAFDPGWSLLVLEDVQRFDAARQQAAFALLVEAQAHALAWAASGDVPPVDLPLRDDLRSRIGWGHVFALEPLGEAETRAVLRREADRRGIFLSDEVMGYLLIRFERDPKFLMQLLDRLDGFALANARAVTVPLLKLMLAEEGLAPEAGP
ncbi:MAG TPA: DnaA/Hda family protein [Rubrivivax sp.]